MDAIRRREFLGAATAGAILPFSAGSSWAGGSQPEVESDGPPADFPALGITLVAHRGSERVMTALGPLCAFLQQVGARRETSWIARPSPQNYIGDRVCGLDPILMSGLPGTFEERRIYEVWRSTWKSVSDEPCPFPLDWAFATALYAQTPSSVFDCRVGVEDGSTSPVYKRGGMDANLFRSYFEVARYGVLVFDTDTLECRVTPDSGYGREHAGALRAISRYQQDVAELEARGVSCGCTYLAFGIGERSSLEVLEESEVASHIPAVNVHDFSDGDELLAHFVGHLA